MRKIINSERRLAPNIIITAMRINYEITAESNAAAVDSITVLIEKILLK